MSHDHDTEYDIPAHVPGPAKNNMPVIEIGELPPDADILALTHGLRLNMLGQMFGPNNKLPEDPAVQKTMVGLLKDMDSGALTRMRIKVEEKQNNNQEQAAGLIAQLLNAAAGSSPFQIKTPINRQAPRLPDSVPDPVLVEGETGTSAVQMSYDTFVAAHGVPPDEQ